MSAIVCSLLSAPKSGFAQLKPCYLLGAEPSLVGSPVHQCLLANLVKIMSYRSVLKLAHLLFFIIIALAHSTYMAQCNIMLVCSLQADSI